MHVWCDLLLFGLSACLDLQGCVLAQYSELLSDSVWTHIAHFSADFFFKKHQTCIFQGNASHNKAATSSTKSLEKIKFQTKEDELDGKKSLSVSKSQCSNNPMFRISLLGLGFIAGVQWLGSDP